MAIIFGHAKRKRNLEREQEGKDRKREIERERAGRDRKRDRERESWER